MVSSTSCPECGEPIAVDAPLGICPACLLKPMVESVPTEPHGSPRGSFEPDPLAPDDLAGRFPDLEILEPIGQGGMGVVYRARQKKLDRLVALKLIRPDSFGRIEFAQRFAREARAMAQLNHPNIATIYDFGEDTGLCSLVMEFVEGDDLQKRLRGGPWEPEPALGVILQVCEALQYAHARGVIHRDIKPGNVLIDQAGRVKIVDFGLAKLVLPEGDIDERMTTTGQVLGTPRYMAPEQIESPRSVDHRADIYAVGLLLYELMTGDVPFGRYELLSERIGTCESLDEILARCLARDPAARYQSIRRLLKDLSEFAEEQYEVVSPARAVLENDRSSTESDEDAEAGDNGLGDWGPLGYLAVYFGFHVVYQNLLGPWPSGPMRLAASLAVCAPFVLFLAWICARYRSWVWLYAMTVLPYLVWFFGDVDHLPKGGWAPACGLLAELGMVASGVAAYWGWRGEAREPQRIPNPARGPAIGLILVGAINWFAFVFGVCGFATLPLLPKVFLGTFALTAARVEPLLPLCVSSAVAGGILLTAGVRLFRGASPELAKASSLLAMAPLTPACLLGVPIGIWTLAVLVEPQGPGIGQGSALDGVKPTADGLNSSALPGTTGPDHDSMRS